MSIKKDILNKYVKSNSKNKPFDSQSTLEDGMRREFKKRDRLITNLLDDYVKNRKSNVETNTKRKTQMYYIFLGTFIVTTLGMIVLIWNVFKMPLTAALAISLLTVCLAYLGTIIILLRSIAQYLFPVDEEKNFTEMIKAVVQKDIEQQKSLTGQNESSTQSNE